MDMLLGDRHIAAWHAFFNNIHYVGAFNSSQFFEFDEKFKENTIINTASGTEEKQSIHRVRVSKHFIHGNYNRIRVNRLQIDILPGQGDPNTNDSDPELFLSVSKDGGVTYENPIRGTMGEKGQFNRRLIYRNLVGS